MPQRPRPHVRPINTGASTIRRQSIARRRNIRRTSTTLPSPLRNFVSASDVTSIQSTAGRYRSRNSVSRTSARVQATNEARSTSAEAEKKPLHELFSPRELQTPRALSLDEAIGQSSHAQAHRATLWRRGSETYGKRDDADVFVNPMQAPPTRSKLFAHPNYNKQTVRAIIHSENRSPIGVARQFNIDQLRATVPEATLSPKSEGFDKDALLSAVIASQSGLLSPPDDKTKEKNCQSAKATTVMPIRQCIIVKSFWSRLTGCFS